MAKSVSELMADALETFAAQGIEITDDMKLAVKREQEKEFRAAAVSAVDKKTNPLEDVDGETSRNRKAREKSRNEENETWVTDLFALAERFEKSFRAEEANKQGRGENKVQRRLVGFDTPVGHLRIQLDQD